MATTASAVINTTDTATNTPTVPDASATTKWQEYIWVRHLAGDDASDRAKFYVWNPNITSVTDGLKTLKWQEVTTAVAFGDVTGTATIAQLPTDITVSNLSIDGAITNTHLAGSIANDKLAGSIVYSKITSVDAASVTSVSNSKIPVNTIPTGLTNTNIDSILGSASVDWDKLNIADADIPGAKIEDGLVHGQIESVSATTITTGTLPLARLAYMFERNLPIDTVANAAGTYNLHTELGTASAVFEGIIRVVATAGSNEVIIALPHPAEAAYLQKAAKLSVYRGTSATPGKVTIKVCATGTNSSSFATNKIVDNNNGEITDQVIILPQLSEAGSRKVVVDVLNDSKSSDGIEGGQWIITGGAGVTGKGKLSVSGIRTGGGVSAPPEKGAHLDKIGINRTPAAGSGETKEFGTDDGDIPEATTARVMTSPSLIDPGTNYTVGQILTVATYDNDWSTEAEFLVDMVETPATDYAVGSRTKAVASLSIRYVSTNWKTGVYTGSGYKFTTAGGLTPVRVTTKLATANQVTTTTPTPHAIVEFYLEGIQPLGTDGNALSSGDAWKDPWSGGTNYVP